MSRSPKLLIDAGNHRLKWRFEGRDYASEWSAETPLESHWPRAQPDDLALVSSVRSEQDNQRIESSLHEQGYRSVFASVDNEANGLICGYRESAQLGIDRWLAMLACWHEEQYGFIYVGAGTALTIDLVYPTGKHGGGYILAGIGLGRQALLSRSEKLATQFSDASPEMTPGTDTSSAINNGALLAAVESVRGVQRAVGMKKAAVIASGGDAELLVAHIKDARHWPNIVLDGLAVWFDGVQKGA